MIIIIIISVITTIMNIYFHLCILLIHFHTSFSVTLPGRSHTPTRPQEWLILPRPMTPRVDGAFLPDKPATLMRQGNYSRVDIMAGVTRDEGGMVANR